MTIRVLIADDHQITRKGLCAHLASIEGLEVVGETADGQATLEKSVALTPDVVVMDISMPLMNGIEATRKIRERLPKCRILALSVHSGKHYIVEMLAAGASGYLLKDCDLDEVVHAIHAVREGKTYLSPALAGVVVGDFVRFHRGEEAAIRHPLSPREVEVLKMLAGGASVKEAAAALGISRKTVETHRARIMEKLGLHTLAELARFAEREGFLS